MEGDEVGGGEWEWEGGEDERGGRTTDLYQGKVSPTQRPAFGPGVQLPQISLKENKNVNQRHIERGCTHSSRESGGQGHLQISFQPEQCWDQYEQLHDVLIHRPMLEEA